jgi:hypothetical protein
MTYSLQFIPTQVGTGVLHRRIWSIQIGEGHAPA